MYMTTRGLVLRIADYNDRDCLLTLLTPNYGKLTVKARGLRRKNSPLTAPCQLLAYSEFTLFEYKDMYSINEAATIELFQPLRRDLCKLTLGTYFVQVSELICLEDQPSPELLSLVLNCLYALSKLDLHEMLVKSVFELRAATIAGYMPDLDGCSVCGDENPDRFNISSGQLSCSNCQSQTVSGIRMPVTPAVLQAMRYIVSCDAKQIFSFQLGSDNLGRLSTITEAYLSAQLERGFSALDFYKSLLL